jgi:hypothetical protein
LHQGKNAGIIARPARTKKRNLFYRRFGYSFPWRDYEEVLRPCDSCRTNLFDTTKPWEYKTGCSHCTNFAYDLNHPLLMHDPDLVGLGPLSPMKLDYHVLVKAVNLAHECYVDGRWSAHEVTEWLKLHCLKVQARVGILCHADKCKEFEDVMANSESSDELKAAVYKERCHQPHLYAK